MSIDRAPLVARILLDFIACAAEEADHYGHLAYEERKALFRVWEYQAGMEPDEETHWTSSWKIQA